MRPEKSPALQGKETSRLLRPLARGLRRLGLLASANRMVLTIGDEGAALVLFRGRQVNDALFVGLDAEDGLATLRARITEDSQAELLVSVDVLEQMYREETLPKVGRFDRRNIILRRLDIAFPQDRLKAAVPLDTGRTPGAAALFAALPVTPALEQWIAFLEDLPNPVVGFCLLPLESKEIVQRLAPSAEGEDRPVWRALVTQQATSGFRQIFETDGRLIVTRLTPRPPEGLTPAAAALLIERELRSSISYIKRLAFSDLDRLDLVVLADPEVCREVKARDLPVTTVSTFTPRRAAEILGFGGVGPEDGPYADVLHAQHLAGKHHPIVTLPTEALRRRLHFETIFKAGFLAAVALSLSAIFYVTSLAVDMTDALGDARILGEMIATEQAQTTTAGEKVKAFAIPIDELAFVDGTRKTLLRFGTKPTGMLRTIALALDPETVVQEVSFTQAALPGAETTARPATPPANGSRNDPASLYEIHLTLRFSDGTTEQSDEILQRARQTRERLSQAFPGHEVSVLQMPGVASHSQVLEGSGTGGIASVAPRPALGEYLIRKKG